MRRIVQPIKAKSTISYLFQGETDDTTVTDVWHVCHIGLFVHDPAPCGGGQRLLTILIIRSCIRRCNNFFHKQHNKHFFFRLFGGELH